jgi:CheY-like chemotaxis protein
MDEIHRVDYDCVFLDYQLPGFDGLMLLKKFKEAGKCQNEIKETTSEQEEAQAKLKVSIKEKERMETEAGS